MYRTWGRRDYPRGVGPRAHGFGVHVDVHDGVEALQDFGFRVLGVERRVDGFGVCMLM